MKQKIVNFGMYSSILFMLLYGYSALVSAEWNILHWTAEAKLSFKEVLAMVIFLVAIWVSFIENEQ